MKRIVQRYVTMVPAARMLLATMAIVVAACGVEDSRPDPEPDPGSKEPDGGPKVMCGDHVCESPETLTSCPADCTCGNHTCEAGETSVSCPQDCPAPVCGNSMCEASETAMSCPADCGARLITRNNSSYTVYHLYVYGCMDSSEGPDQLKGYLLYPGYQYTLSGIPPGCYLFHATISDGSGWRTPMGVPLKSAETTTWTLTN